MEENTLPDCPVSVKKASLEDMSRHSNSDFYQLFIPGPTVEDVTRGKVDKAERVLSELYGEPNLNLRGDRKSYMVVLKDKAPVIVEVTNEEITVRGKGKRDLLEDYHNWLVEVFQQQLS